MKKKHTKMDILVLAVVLALIAGAFVRVWMVRRLPQTVTFTYQLTLIDPDEGVAAQIIPGEAVSCVFGKQSIGTVTQVQTGEEGVVLTLQAEGFPIEGGFHTNVYDILPDFQDEFYQLEYGPDTVLWEGVITSVPEVIS